MLNTFTSNHFSDADGNPAGGTTYGPGFAIGWQNGPLAVGVRPDECIVPEHAWIDGAGDPHTMGQRDGAQAALRGIACRRAPSGAFVETVIAAAKDRIEYYQQSRFASDDNAEAIAHLEAALVALHRRTAVREARGVEGTHTV